MGLLPMPPSGNDMVLSDLSQLVEGCPVVAASERKLQGAGVTVQELEASTPVGVREAYMQGYARCVSQGYKFFRHFGDLDKIAGWMAAMQVSKPF
jgi:hypothetical protein